eukprot:6490950-Amphidinium_carterae.1
MRELPDLILLTTRKLRSQLISVYRVALGTTMVSIKAESSADDPGAYEDAAARVPTVVIPHALRAASSPSNPNADNLALKVASLLIMLRGQTTTNPGTSHLRA